MREGEVGYCYELVPIEGGSRNRDEVEIDDWSADFGGGCGDGGKVMAFEIAGIMITKRGQALLRGSRSFFFEVFLGVGGRLMGPFFTLGFKDMGWKLLRGWVGGFFVGICSFIKGAGE